MFAGGAAVGGSTDERLGTLEITVPTGPEPTLQIDAALVRPAQRARLSRDINAGPTVGIPRDLLREELYEPVPVFKRGARTGLTSGWAHPGTSTRKLVDQTHGECIYQDGFLIESSSSKPFALPGDSGSIVVDAEDRVIGMIVGVVGDPQAESARAFCTPIPPILETLGINLIGPG